jgi:pilus assembly protein CpaE
VTIALDRETHGLLRLYLPSLPLKIRAEMSSYGPQETEVAPEWLAAGAVDICLVDFDTNPERAVAFAEQIHMLSPETAIFGVSSNAQPETLIEAMRSGCSEYLFKPLAREQLVQAVGRVGARRRERKEQQQQQTATAQVMTFVGAKGGCGVTTLATQLGIALAKLHSKKTLLIDFHSGLGDAALYLGFTNFRYHSYELVDSTERLDAELLQSLALHHSSGLDLVPAPEDFDLNRKIAANSMSQMFGFLRQRYDFIIVDAPPGLNEQIQRLITQSDFLYIVTVAEVSALRNVTRILDYMAQREVVPDRVRVVLNRFDKRSPIPETQIEKVIRRKIFWQVPNQYFQAVKAVTGADSTANLMRSDLMRNIGGWAESVSAKSGNAGNLRKKRGLMSLFGSAEE